MKNKKEDVRGIDEMERKKFRIKIVATVVILTLVNVFVIVSYYSYSNEKLMDDILSEDVELEEIENLSVEERNFMQGRVVAELEDEFGDRLFVFTFGFIMISFFVVIFLVSFFRKRAEGNIISFELGKLRGKARTEKRDRRIGSGDIKLFGDFKKNGK